MEYIENRLYVSCWEGYNENDEEEYDVPYEGEELDCEEIAEFEEENYSQYYSSSSESDEEFDYELQ